MRINKSQALAHVDICKDNILLSKVWVYNSAYLSLNYICKFDIDTQELTCKTEIANKYLFDFIKEQVIKFISKDENKHLFN